MEYEDLTNRIFADFDNEIVQDPDIVGLTQTDSVTTFSGGTALLKEGDYVYMFMSADERLPEYLVAEGVVIPNPYDFKPYKWCARIVGEIEYFDEYEQRFKHDN